MLAASVTRIDWDTMKRSTLNRSKLGEIKLGLTMRWRVLPISLQPHSRRFIREPRFDPTLSEISRLFERRLQPRI